MMGDTYIGNLEAVSLRDGTIAEIEGWNMQPDHDGQHHTGRWVWDASHPARWWPEYEGDSSCDYETDVVFIDHVEEEES